ncbi:mitochondrial carrier domain-containing protein [Roridomyces roridus]|uniref:Mitochondrial carrier domain-containing protein n=1 Tax=Roridomyces roridus TaxID=1738132 RepID=A0AAD7BUS3_9AGAR|nr:mitochondrial carrier domain-containing protein [Roridomyces roridus]
MDELHAKFVAASAGSAMTALTMTPFDVVKTRLQTQPVQVRSSRPSPAVCCQPPNVQCIRNMSSLARPVAAEQLVCVWDHGMLRTEPVKGFSDAVRHVLRAEGVRGLWKGLGTTLVIGVPSATSYMLTYDHLLNVVLPPLLPAAVVPLSAGILARSTITSIVSPLELIRTNLQSTPASPLNPNTLSSVLTDIRALVRKQGARVLWRGLGPTLWRDVPFSGLYWAGYETTKKFFARNGKSGAWVAFFCGAFSGTSAALVTNPFDVLKTRRQAMIMSSSSSTTTSSLPVLLRIVRTEGASSVLFAGLLPRVVKTAPACGIMIACYEGVARFLVKK